MEIVNDEALKLIDDFKQAELVFVEMQQEHALYLRRHQLADVQSWSNQRSQAMGQLQQALSAVWQCDSLRSDVRLGKSLQKRIGEIVERERELAIDVKSCQEQLKGEMGTIRKGKRVIGGYGATASSKSTGLCFKNSL